MNHKPINRRLLLALSACLLAARPAEAQQVATPAATPQAAATPRAASQPILAGAPLVAARQTAINARSFLRPLDVDKIRKWMEISSRCTIEEFELFLAPLAPNERQLVQKLITLQPPIVNRLHFDDLRTVLQRGQLTSYQVDEQAGSHLRHTTPALENDLYGAYDCVFASVGPPDGTPRYGDVIIRLKDSVREHGWATPFSGMHFVDDVRHQDATAMQQMLADGRPLPTASADPLSLGFDDRLHFSHYVVTEQHWNKALAYQAILVLRNAGDSPAGQPVRDRFAKLLQTPSPDEFWRTFIPPREENLPPAEAEAREPFGYLEGKFANRLSIEDFTSIEVPPDKLEQVLTWPESQPHRSLIRSKRPDAL